MMSEADLRWEKRQKAAQKRKSIRDQAVAYKGGKCEICGYDKCSAGFDFHHVDPMEKDFTISDRMSSFSAIKKELDKCVLLCCRCHREVHDGWHPSFLALEGADRGPDEFDDDPYDDGDVDDCFG